MQGTLRVHDRAHLYPVAEEHDGDEGGQLPPEVRADAGDRGIEAVDKGDGDGQRNERHHAGEAVLEFGDRASEKDHPAVEKEKGPKDGRKPGGAGKLRHREAEPRMDHRRVEDDRDGEEQAEPELRLEQGRAVPRVLVVPYVLVLVVVDWKILSRGLILSFHRHALYWRTRPRVPPVRRLRELHYR